jgi:phage repressor protein C with HTH and peptisase S24 domain
LKRKVRRRSLLAKSAADGSAEDYGSFVGRLRMLVNRAGSVLALARDAKVSDSSIHLWLDGSEPSREKLVRLAQASNVTVEWLAAGRGPMNADLLPEGYVLVRRYKGDSKLDSKIEYEGVDYLALKRDWIRSLPGSPSAEALFLTQVEGDAMAPSIEDGDLILVNTSDRKLRDGVWLLSPSTWIEGKSTVSISSGTATILVRRVRAEGGGKFRLLCDNKDFESPPGQTGHSTRDGVVVTDLVGDGILAFKSIGRVIWKGGDMS